MPDTIVSSLATWVLDRSMIEVRNSGLRVDRSPPARPSQKTETGDRLRETGARQAGASHGLRRKTAEIRAICWDGIRARERATPKARVT
jgi:hypothetical protein